MSGINVFSKDDIVTVSVIADIAAPRKHKLFAEQAKEHGPSKNFSTEYKESIYFFVLLSC